jgi:hypothetical protein
MLQRTDQDQMLGNSNGATKPFQAAKPFKGIPVTVRIPTHVDVAIKETLFFHAADMTPVALTSRHLSVASDYVYSDKIISVDPKRPAAGTLDYKMGFQSKNPEARDQQFFSKVQYDVDDQTIKTVDKILQDIVPSLGIVNLNASQTAAKRTGKEVATSPENLSEIVRTVAWKRFDVSDPNFESELTTFVSMHMNNCHACQGQECAPPSHSTVVESVQVPS